MTSPYPQPDRPDPGGLSATVTRLEGQVRSMAADQATLLERMGELEDEVAAARRDAKAAIKAAGLVAGGAAPQPDAATKVLTFLDSLPGIKFNPTSIAENIGLDNGLVAERCSRLALDKKIVRHAQEGRTPLYSSKKGKP